MRACVAQPLYHPARIAGYDTSFIRGVQRLHGFWACGLFLHEAEQYLGTRQASTILLFARCTYCTEGEKSHTRGSSGRETVILGLRKALRGVQQCDSVLHNLSKIPGLIISGLAVCDFVEASDLLGCAF